MTNLFKKNKTEKNTYKITFVDGTTEMVTMDKLGMNNLVVNDYTVEKVEKIK